MAKKRLITAQDKEDARTEYLAGATVCELGRKYGKNESTIRGWLKGGKGRAKPEEIKEMAVKSAMIETKAETLHPLDQKIYTAVKADTMDMLKNIRSAGTDTSAVAQMFAKAARDAAAQIMLKAAGEDGKTVSPELLASFAEEVAATMKSVVVANEASKIGIKLLEIAAKTPAEEKKAVEDKPVKFYIPQNGR
jgi:electron transfer flavoprotein alpha subunit